MRQPMWKRIKNRLKELGAKTRELYTPGMTRDNVNLDLWGLRLIVGRETTSPVPSELSVIIPRAEFRHTCKAPDQCVTEIILSSITIVLSPRHPQESRPDIPASLPPAKRS